MAKCLCFLFVALLAEAQEPLLLVTGLPCPGSQGEVTNAHGLLWNCVCAEERGRHHEWRNWQETVAVHYGDVVTATWYSQCRAHAVDWDFLRLDLVITNGGGGYETNSATVKMKAGYNFDVSFVYWFTNNGSLIPTNFDAGQIAVGVGSNQTPVIGVPLSLRGTKINPPIWLGGTNAISDPKDWPPWGSLAGGFPHGSFSITNADGAQVITPEAQVPFWNLLQGDGTNIAFTLQALPGVYDIDFTMDLLQPWNFQTNLVAGNDGSGRFSAPLDKSESLFFRLRGEGPSIGLGYILRLQTLGSAFEPAIYCDNGNPQEFLWDWSDGTSSPVFPLSSKDFGSPNARFQNLRVYLPATITAINLGFDGSDGGQNTPLTNRAPQNVGAVNFPYPLPALRYWGSSYNPITNTLDFAGFTSLEAIECFHCTNLPHATVAHLPALKRLCFESCSLYDLDLTDDPNLADVRAALNAFTSIKIGGGTGPKIWHWCIRDNPQITQDFAQIMTNFYSLQEPWFWNANQRGVLTFVSTNLTDVEVQNNYYEHADFTDQTNLQICWIFNNRLTNLLLSGCVGLQELRAEENQLPGQVLDDILAFLDTSAPAIQMVDLIHNAGLPSLAGYTNYSNLTNRGVVVYLDFPLPSGPVVGLSSGFLALESCAPTNNAIDPGETVTLEFAFRNSGTADTTNLAVTLLETNGVTAASGPQNYGALTAGGLAVTRVFSFTASGECGGIITPTFQLQDGALDLGTISVPFVLGQAVTVFSEDFDAVTNPALPAAWATLTTGAQTPWFSTNATADTGSNSVGSLDPPNPGISDLVSPLVTLPSSPTQLTFRNNYDLEPDHGNTADDGGVLEIQIGTNVFADILDAGGSFVTGGYNRTITNIYNNPLAGRQAWSGNSGGYITTMVNLPTAAQGETIQLRWRCATDNGNSSGALTGWHIDTIAITSRNCCTNAP